MSILTTGLSNTRRLQGAAEATVGTAVTDDFIWQTEEEAPDISDDRELVHVPQQMGYFPPSDVIYIPKLDTTLAIPSMPATYEQIAHIFEGGIQTVTPSQDGSGTDYISTRSIARTTQNTIKTYTWYAGDNIQAQRMNHAYVVDFQFTGTAGEALKCQSNWRGQTIENATFASLTPATQEIINASNGKLYIDAAGGTVGTTQITNTLLSIDLTVTTGWMPVYSMDGNKYLTGIKMGRPSVVLKMTLEFNSTANTQRTAWRNRTAQLFRLRFTGEEQHSTPGTTYTYNELIFDIAGKYTAFSTLGQNEGNDVVEVTVTGMNNISDSLYFTTILVNELSAVP